MTRYAAVLSPSLTDNEGHSKFLNRLFSSGVATNFNANAWKVVQRGAGANMSVDVSVGDGLLSLPTNAYAFWAWSDLAENVVISAANPTNPRIDAIIAYIDTTVTTTVSANSPGALKFLAVPGTPSGSPTAPSDGTISAYAPITGSTAWIRLANVTVGAGVTSIVTANIADTRVAISAIVAALIASGAITTAKLADGAVTPVKQGTGGLIHLGSNAKKTQGTVLPNTYTTYCTVTASCTGGEVQLDYRAKIRDGVSGAARTGEVRVQMDGVTVTDSMVYWKTPATDTHADISVLFPYTPAAGSHTWTLQVLANTASASLLDQATLRITEVKP